jgi:putative Holliday junction resolvase
MPDTPDRARPQTLLAFDFGHRRIGVAVGQQITDSANPLGTATNGVGGPDWAQISHWVDEWRPDRLVVGLPLHADGSPSDLSADALEFANELARYERPVDSIDERFTSMEARGILKQKRASGRRGRIRKKTIDATAAMLIAERWLSQNS